ncbi:MAG TPA: CPBP family intramembrane glutamic endopeptidase [Longimicrobiales bacterium]
MRRGWRAVGAVLAAALVWAASDELAWPARAFLVALLAVLPPLSVAQARAIGPEAALPRVPVYLSSAAALWVLGLLALGAGLGGGFTPRQLGLVAIAPVAAVGWTAALLGAAVALAAAWRAFGLAESAILLGLLPRTSVEKALFVGLSLSAGVTEELVFRGFLVPALGAATGLPWLAVALSAGAFGVVHAYQSAAGVVRAALLGLILTVPFLVTGSLVPSMLAHFLYDALAGLWLADWLLGRR